MCNVHVTYEDIIGYYYDYLESKLTTINLFLVFFIMIHNKILIISRHRRYKRPEMNIFCQYDMLIR